MTPPAALDTRILLISGSLRSGSASTAALCTARELVPAGASTVLYPGLASLPHFSPDLDAEPLPAAVAALRQELRQADALLLSTPEYAGSLPGSFKNLLDWSVSHGLHRKSVGWINPSAPGRARGAYAALRGVLGYIEAELVEEACVQIPIERSAIGADGVLADPALRAAIAEVLTALVRHARARPRE